MTPLLPSLNSTSPNMQKSVTLQRSVDKRFGNPSFVTEYVDEYAKKQAGKASHQIYDKRTGKRPEWLEKIENAPAPKIDDEALFKTRNSSLFKDDYPVSWSKINAVQIRASPAIYFNSWSMYFYNAVGMHCMKHH